MKKTGISVSATSATMVILGLILATTFGCEREEYEPEAVPAAEDGSAEEPSAGKVDGFDRFEVNVSEAEIDVDEPATVILQVVPGQDLKINTEYPWDFEFDEVEGLELGASRLRIGDMELSDEEATIPVELTAVEAGRHTLAATADFSVCNDERCDIMRDERIEFEVVAQ